MNTSERDAEAACLDCLNRFFSEHEHLMHLQDDSIESLRLLVADGAPLTGRPAGWAAGIVYAVANDGRWPCGVPGLLNAEFEQAFGVTMSTVRKRVGAVQRAEVLCRLNGHLGLCQKQQLYPNLEAAMLRCLGLVADSHIAKRPTY